VLDAVVVVEVPQAADPRLAVVVVELVVTPLVGSERSATYGGLDCRMFQLVSASMRKLLALVPRAPGCRAPAPRPGGAGSEADDVGLMQPAGGAAQVDEQSAGLHERRVIDLGMDGDQYHRVGGSHLVQT
jgi:hypothetical protein